MTNPLTILFCALALGSLSSPQDPSPAVQAGTARFASAMQATGLRHEKSPSGKSYLVGFSHGDLRRTIYVQLQPDEPGGLLTHNVYTTVWTGNAAPDEALMRKLFAFQRKLGAYYLFVDGKGTWAVRFGVVFDATDLGEKSGPDDTLAKRLRATIEYVDAVAEQTAKDLKS